MALPSISSILEFQKTYGKETGRFVPYEEAKEYLSNNSTSFSDEQNQTYSGIPTRGRVGVGQPSDPGYWGTEIDETATWAESAGDFLRSGAWNLWDTATLGLTGLAWQKLDKPGYESFQRELYDTALGRVGGTLGGLAGFLVPYGAVGKATSAITRFPRTLNQARKINKAADTASRLKKATDIVKTGLPTTRTVQRAAAYKILDASEKLAAKRGAKALTFKESKQIAHELTDDVIGFTNKKLSWYNPNRLNYGRRGPAYTMEHSADFIANTKQFMKQNGSERLASLLSRRGINLTNNQVAKLSDELVELIATKPFNQIESVIAGYASGKYLKPFMNFVGVAGQEAVNFGIVGTMMDYVGSLKGEVDLKKSSLKERFLHHAVLGSAFGGLKFVPGGTGRGAWKSFVDYTGSTTRKVNSGIKRMNLQDTKNTASILIKNEGALLHTPEGALITRNMLKATSNVLKNKTHLQSQIIAHNKKRLIDFRKLAGGVTGEMAKDILTSLPRMALGSFIFNYASLADGSLMNMGLGETYFHLGLGAMMTKSGRPLIENGTPSGRMFTFGQKPYVYNGDLREIVGSMKNMRFTVDHIGEIAKEFEGGLFEDYLIKNPNHDFEAVISVLENKKNSIIHNVAQSGVSLSDMKADNMARANLNPELAGLLVPITRLLRARGYEFNKDATTGQMVDAVREISNLESSLLSTPDNVVRLNSATNIRKSLLEGSVDYWSNMRSDLFNNYKEIMSVLFGGGEAVNERGQINQWTVAPAFKNNLTTYEKQAISNIIRLEQRFVSQRVLKRTDIAVGQQIGIDISPNLKAKLVKVQEMVKKWEDTWGKEFYGENAVDPMSMLDNMMWHHFKEVDFHKNTSNVMDIIANKESPNVNPADLAELNTLIYDVLGNSPAHGGQNKFSDSVHGDVRRIKIDYEGSNLSGRELVEEARKLDNFIIDMHRLAVASGRDPNGGQGDYVVPYGKARRLYEKITEMGMPDYFDRINDTRLDTWIERAVTYGIDNMTGGLDMSPHDAAAVKRLMLNGWLVTSSGSKRGTPTLEMPLEITKRQIQSIIPSASAERVESLQKSYESVKSRLENIMSADRNYRAIRFKQDYEVTRLTQEQLEAIERVEYIYKSDKAAKELSKTSETIFLNFDAVEERIKILEEEFETLDKANRPSDAKVVRDVLLSEKHKSEIFTEIQWQYHKSIGAGLESSRAAAMAQQMSRLKNGENKSYMKLINELQKSNSIEESNLLHKEIKDLRNQIAQRVADRPDVLTLWDEKSQKNILKEKHMETEGRSKDPDKPLSIGKFVDKYSITEDKFKDLISNEYYRDPSDAIGIFYRNTVDVVSSHPEYSVKLSKFVEGMYKLTGNDSSFKGLNKKKKSELLDDVAKIVTTNERRFAIRKLTIGDGGAGHRFDNGYISKSSFTDLWTEIFGIEPLNQLNSDFIKDGKVNSILSEGFEYAQTLLNGADFHATLKKGAEYAIKHKNSRGFHRINPNQGDHYLNMNINDLYVKGKHSIISVDENMHVLMPIEKFHELGVGFKGWLKEVKKEDYVKNSIKKNTDVAQLFDRLDRIDKRLDKSLELVRDVDLNESRRYQAKSFNGARDKDVSIDADMHLQNDIFTMFNVMYGEKVNSNWLLDAYSGDFAGLKEFKYRRLASNAGYSRNSNERRLLAKEIFKNSDDSYKVELVKKYTDLEYDNVLVLDDSRKSEIGEHLAEHIGDAKTNAMKSLELQKKDLTEAQYKNMKKIIEESNSLLAEEVNGMTAVRRDRLDWGLLINGDGPLIGNSPGQKPVGLTSFTDAAGVKHVFYNKTHYFYDSRLDPFFAENKNIHMIAFKSGAKKSSQIDPVTLKDQFVPYELPKMRMTDANKADNNLTNFINGLKFDKKTPHIDPKGGIFRQRIDQTLAGTNYGNVKDAKILKQFDNWTSAETAADLYQLARADAINKFGEARIELYSPEHVGKASAEAQLGIAGIGNPDGTITKQSENMSFAAIFLEEGGVPFSAAVKSSYDAIIQKKYIDNAGVFDGYTDAGGVPVLRGNLDGNLSIPIYEKNINGHNVQVKLGQSNVSSVYLDKPIYFSRAFGKVPKGDKILQNQKVQAANITLAVEMEGRDIIVDLKGNKVFDPKRLLKDTSDPLKEFNLSDKDYTNVKSKMELIQKKLSNGDIEMWRDLYAELRTNRDLADVYLAIELMPTPRIGPQDAMLTKVSKAGLLDPKDGGVIELNNYDLTMRGQRDMDTDKLPFYMDLPFSAVKEAMATNGRILEPEPLEKFIKEEVNIYDHQSYKKHLKQVNLFKKARGATIKMHRKLSFAKRLFDKVGGIKIRIDDKDNKVNIKFNSDHWDATQRLSNDSQNILDIYSQLPESKIINPENMKDWEMRTLFGNTRKSSDVTNVDVKNDKPFFILETLDKDNKRIKNASGVLEEGHKLIVKKVLDDFGRLLSLESNIYEYGEGKSPRYKDMHRMYRTYIESYRTKRVNYETFDYLVKAGHGDWARKLFYGSDPVKEKNKAISPIMDGIATELQRDGGPTPFLKALKGIADTDHMRVSETYSPKGDSFNQQLDVYVGKLRHESLERLKYEKDTGIDFAGSKDGDRRIDYARTEFERFEGDGWYTDKMWDAFKGSRTFEQMLVQANTIEGKIRRLEKLISKEEKAYKPDNAWVEVQKENVVIQRRLLDDMLTRLEVSDVKEAKKEFDQTIITQGEITAPVVGVTKISNKITGKKIKELKKGDKSHLLENNEVAIINPVTLRASNSHEIIDGAAVFHTVSGYWAHVKDVDITDFSRIVKRTRVAINGEMSTILNKKGYRDWESYHELVQKDISKGLEDIINLAKRNAAEEGIMEVTRTSFGPMPIGRETYGLDFLMTLLGPDYTKNPNEYYMLGKSRTLISSVRKPNKQIIKAVFRAMESYKVHENQTEFIKTFARTHRAFYEALVGGENYHTAFTRLSESSFEGALMKHTMDKALNQPFMRRKDYLKLGEEMEIIPQISSEFAELFRSVIQDGAMLDPHTAFRLRELFIRDPKLGEEAYKDIFKLSRGSVMFDGISSGKMRTSSSEGQLVGEITMSTADKIKRNLTGNKYVGKKKSMSSHIESIASRQNEKDTEALGKVKCD